MPSPRPFFLSGFFAAFGQQRPPLPTTQQPNKHSSQAASSSSPSPPTATAAAAASSNPSATANYAHQSSSTARATSNMAIPPSSSSASSPHSYSRSPPTTGVSFHSPRGGATTAANGIPIPNPSTGRRRGSDSSSEGFRDALGADKWYVGGRTAGGEERFFKLGVMRRVRSNDGLSLDRLSL